MRSEYYPIYFIAPQEEMKSILGFDLGADATQLAALQRARDTGFATVISAAMLLPPDFAERMIANRSLFPQGIDLLLVCGAQFVALPRTVHITAKEA